MNRQTYHTTILSKLSDAVASATLREEAEVAANLQQYLDLDAGVWADISAESTRLITKIRSAETTPLIDQFLTEFGLSSEEGVQLMRLAEALSRTSDRTTADQLISDKLKNQDWLSHGGQGKSVAIRLTARLLHVSDLWLRWSDRQRSGLGKPFALIGNAALRFGTRIFIRALSSQFVFAETLHKAMNRATKYGRDGYLFSFDMLGEAARTQRDASNYYAAYERALDTVVRHARSNEPSKNQGISIKLSALHPRYEYAQAETAIPEIAALLRPLAMRAREANVQITIDAEEAERLDISMAVLSLLIAMPELNGWNGLGFVVQAYQRRALPLLDWLEVKAKQHGAPIIIRLVKGAYWDSEIKRAQELGLSSYPVFTRKATTDLSYLACAKKLLSNPECFAPQFATHNAHSIAAVRQIAGPDRQLEFQRLFGMGQQLHDLILKHPRTTSRIYAPVGTQKDLLSYLIRRLLENGANSSFVHKLADNNVSVAELVTNPVEQLRKNTAIANQNIASPTGYLGDGRIAAQGVDLSNPLDRSFFESAIAGAAKQTFQAAAIIAGKEISTSTEPVTNPSNREDVVGLVANGDAEIANKAIRTAKRAFESWSIRPPADRARCLESAADLLEQRAALFHYLAIKEAGKSWVDAIDEVREAVDFCRYYAAQARDPQFQNRSALGVVVCISPWNFPLAIFLGQITAALAAGNSVVAKPADQTPLIAAEAIHLLHDAGIDSAAINLVPGRGAIVGEALVANPDTAGVCFTGSTATAKRIALRLAETGRALTPLIAETGGINAMIVDSSALLEQTVDAVISSAFQSAGQRCSALRMLCLQEDIADECIALLAGAMKALTVGDPAKLSNDIGPVIDTGARQMILDHITTLEESVRRISEDFIELPKDGNFIAPSAFELDDLSQIDREIFGPVLHVVRFRADQKMEMIEKINQSGYGLTLGIQSRIEGLSNALANNADVGNIYINRNQIGAVVGTQPFGGQGLSGTGPKAGGPLYLYRLSTQVEPRPQPQKPPEPEAQNCSSIAKSQWQQILSASVSASKEFKTSFSQLELSTLFTDARLAELARDEIRRMGALVNQELNLPSTVGETNEYRTEGRGVIVSLLHNPDDILNCCIRSIVSGNAFLHFTADSHADLLAKIGEEVGAATGITGLISQCENTNIADIEEGLTSRQIAAVILHRDDPRIERIAKYIAQSNGPIIPILTPSDGAERYVHEKVLTNNIAATGGDVSLLNA